MADNQYLQTLETIKKIRETLGQDSALQGGQLDLPQMCVVGDQSCGKSSLLQRMTGIQFPVDSGICTKTPIVVCCSRDEEFKEDKYKVNGVECERQDVSNMISDEQSVLLRLANGKVSSTEIKVTVTGPNQMDIMVIDLPGIIHNGDGKKETVDLINRYIQPQQTLIIVVSEAKQDKEGIGALELAVQADKKNERTLRVLTKCDIFDSEDTKTRAIDLVHEEVGRPLGAHAVICCPDGNSEDYSYEFEKRILHDKMQINVSRSGIDSLKMRLPQLFANLIQTIFPKLREQVATKLMDLRVELSEIGMEQPNPKNVVLECQQSMMKQCIFQREITAKYTLWRDEIFSTEEDISEEWTKSFIEPNVFRNPIFEGNDAFELCAEQISEKWKEKLVRFCSNVVQLLEDSVQCNVDGVADAFKTAVKDQWLVFCGMNAAKYREKCMKAINRERRFGTQKRYPMVQLLFNERAKGLLEPEIYVESHQDKEDAADTWFMMEQGIRVYASVKAHWEVESKFIVDEILKITDVYVLQKRKRWIQSELWSDQLILKHAMESEEVTKRRVDLKKTMERLREAQVELHKMV